MLHHIQHECLRANTDHNLLYLNNPKVGCSTVKAQLWREISPDTFTPDTDVHDVALSPLHDRVEDLDWLEQARVFTFVRNPYVRVLSAYLNKIKTREAGVWEWFASRHQLAEDAALSFDQFLDLILSEDPEYLDPHWRPQTINVMFPFVQPNAIGHLEDMDTQLQEVLSWLFDRPITLGHRQALHSTGASELLEHYYDNAATLDKVHTLYGSDFDAFHYARDLSVAHQCPAPLKIEDHPHPGLAALHQLEHNPPGTEARHLTTKALEARYGNSSDPMVQDWLRVLKLQDAQRDPATLRQVFEAQETAIKGRHHFLKATARDLSRENGFADLAARFDPFS